MINYHDTEWGKPVRESRALWEKLMLDGFQAGLSWRIVLKKRDALRLAFCNFEPQKVAEFTEEDIERLVKNADIIRSRSKIMAVINNAKMYLAMQQAGKISVSGFGRRSAVKLSNIRGRFQPKMRCLNVYRKI